MNVRELYSVTISLNEDRVLLIKYKDNVYVDLEESKRIMNSCREMVGKELFYLIVDARDVLGSIDYESRDFMAKHELNKLNIAKTIVVNNIPIRLLANFYFNFYKHNQPTKVFTDIVEAREWVLSQG